MASIIKVDQIQSDSGSVAFTGNTSFDTNTVYIDSVNDRVGFGTITPSYKYDFKTSGNSSGGGLALTNTDTDSYSWVMMPDYNIAGGEASGLNIVRSGTGIYMKIDRSGRVTLPYQPGFFSEFGNGAIAGLVSGTDTEISNYGTPQFNRGSHFNITSGRFTAPITGVYNFHGYIQLSSGALMPAQAVYYVYLKVNGTTKVRTQVDTIKANDSHTVGCTMTIQLTAGDYVSLYGYQASVSTASLNSGAFMGYLVA